MVTRARQLPDGTALNHVYTVIQAVGTGTGAEGPRYLAGDAAGQQYYVHDTGPHRPDGAAHYREVLGRVRQFSHPNLAAVVDSFAGHGREFIVMAARPGRTLQQIVLAAVVPSRRRLHALLHQVCMALAYVDSQQPAFVFDTLAADEILVDSAGHISIGCYRLGRCFESGAVPVLSADVQRRNHNYDLLGNLVEYIMTRTQRTVGVRPLDPRVQALVQRLHGFADTPGYSFQEASRSLGVAMGTGMLLAGPEAEPVRARRTTEELYATRTVYTGVDRDGRMRTGELHSDTIHEAVAKLKAHGVKVKDVRFETGSDRLVGRLRRLPRIPLILAFVALCLAGTLYTLHHRTRSGPGPQHDQVFAVTGDGALLAIDVPTLGVRSIKTLGGPVMDVKVLAGGSLLAMISARTRALSFVRSDTGEPVHPPHPWTEPVDKLLASPARDLLYCVSKDHGLIAVLSARDLSLQTTLKARGRLGDAVLSSNGKLLFLSLPDLNTVDVVDSVLGSPRTRFGVPGGPAVLGASRTNEVWIGNRTGVVSIVALDGPRHPVAPTARFSHPIVSFAFPGGTSGFVLCDDGSVTPVGASGAGSSVSADGPGPMAWTLGRAGELWLSSGRDNEVHLLDLGGHASDRRISLPGRPMAMDLAP